MARILEALRQTETIPLAVPVAVVKPVLAPVDEGSSASDEVPFIEVGGAMIEASPIVLKSGLPHRQAKASSSAKSDVTLDDLLPVPDPVLAAALAVVSFHPLPSAKPALPPRERFAPELIAYHESEHPISQQYQSLLGSVLAQVPTGTPAILMFSGLEEKFGTTTVALNLALTLTRTFRQRCVVVDANVQRPAVATRLGLPEGPGLYEVCSGQLPLNRVLRESGQPRLLVLPAGAEPNTPGLPLQSLLAVLQDLRKRCDVVFLDTPTWHSGADMAQLAEACDALFLVMPNEHIDKPETAALMQSLPRQGLRLRGCVLTRRAG